ncbi:hypothetical protein HK102_014186 [Quaeritorhiza haematococci]|nr:hypothetical protein HK102_014186 [Quaeritorhiza haematococci]
MGCTDYGDVVRGSLKLKSAGSLSVKNGGIKKKKKKSTPTISSNSSSSQTTPASSSSSTTEIAQGASTNLTPAYVSETGKYVVFNTSKPVPVVKKTKAQLAFEAVQKARQQERIMKIASKSHKEKVEEFNAYLESLSEHHDIPRVGPG